MLRSTPPVLALLFTVACEPAPSLRVKRSEGPAERTLAALRPQYGEAIRTCDFAQEEPITLGVTLMSPDSGLRIRVPSEWSPVPTIDTIVGPVDTTIKVVWRNGARSIIVLQRVRFAYIGITWTEQAAQPLTQQPTCEIALGNIGAIWRRYDPVQPEKAPRPFPYTAHGEIITADSLRYKAYISAPSAQERDRLARWISESAIGASQR